MASSTMRAMPRLSISQPGQAACKSTLVEIPLCLWKATRFTSLEMDSKFFWRRPCSVAWEGLPRRWVLRFLMVRQEGVYQVAWKRLEWVMSSPWWVRKLTSRTKYLLTPLPIPVWIYWHLDNNEFYIIRIWWFETSIIVLQSSVKFIIFKWTPQSLTHSYVLFI